MSTFGVEHLRETLALDPDDVERRAIIQHDGGYRADVAERFAREGWNAADWRRWHGELVARYRRVDTEIGAQRRAYGGAINEWHARHGAKAAPGACSGCGKPIDGRAVVLALPDGAGVHGNGLQCLTDYGRRWRLAAGDGLRRLGIEAPAGDTP